MRKIFTWVPNTPESILARFVIDSNGCHIWTGVIGTKDGYPLVKYKSKTHRAIRLAYTFRHGPIAPDLDVCHTCDVRTCMRDEHHFLGTKAENIADKVAKGRQARGAWMVANRNTPRGDRHWMRLRPEDIPRGIKHHMFGKPSNGKRDGTTGRFVKTKGAT